MVAGYDGSMTSEERFERIDATLLRVAEMQERQAVALIELTGAISRHVDLADARMQQIEANLDGLIRAITAEHTNGKKGQ